ncbi:MAG TPA: DUF4190 domain-containing protein [Desulfuromonadaceae bacterium]|nr:DUF4190 domain-containing protein [Desulfuromonadaceae bacterium]
MYKIIGADGREYGPVTAEQLRRWVAEGRVNAQTRIQAEGSTDWQPIGTRPEFTALFMAAVPPGFAPLTLGSVRKTNGNATAGLIFGVLSWFVCCCYGMPLNFLGIVFSLIALSQINRHPDLYEGRGAAVAGLVLSICSLLFYGALLVWALANDSFRFSFGNQFGQ